MTVELIPLEGLPEVEPGDDLAGLLEPALASAGASDGDVVAITQKVVSKAEGRLVPAEDRAAWIERESVAVVARRGELVITRTRHGLVCANAGIDASNVPAGLLTLLPEDPDASAERLQKELSGRLELSRLGVVITDTFGRPWREGLVDVAIGCAGMPALLDLRGTADDHGRALDVTVVALADAVAAASGLVMTKTARVPAALVRGLSSSITGAPPGPARELIRAPEDDLFRESALRSLSSATLRTPLAPGDVDDTAMEEAVRTACAIEVPGDAVFVAVRSAAARRRLLATIAAPPDPLAEAPVLIVPCARAPALPGEATSLLAAGARIQTLTLALHAHHVACWWDPAAPFDTDGARLALGLDRDWRPLGIIAVGPAPEGGTSRPRPSVDLGSVLVRRN